MFTELDELETLLVFATGADTIPALGFDPQPTITFGHDVEVTDFTAAYPVANTCTNTLRLPVLPSYDEFYHNCYSAIHAVLFFTAE